MECPGTGTLRAGAGEPKVMRHPGTASVRGLYLGETGQGCLLLSSSRAFETMFPQKGMGERGGNRWGCRTILHISVVSWGWDEAARCGAEDQSYREAACSRVGAGERKVSRSESLIENRTHGSVAGVNEKLNKTHLHPHLSGRRKPAP